MLLAIDPGKRAAGAALFDDGELAVAWYERADKRHALDYGWSTATAIAVAHGLRTRVPECVLQTLVIERPQVYKAQFLKGDPNDLVDLALMGGALSGILHGKCRATLFYLPCEWKGQVVKAAMNARIKKRLSEDEQRRIDWPAKSLQHNVWDAIGIGLKAVGRL